MQSILPAVAHIGGSGWGIMISALSIMTLFYNE